MTMTTKSDTAVVGKDNPQTVAPQPAKLASWMVAQSYTRANRAEGVQAFRAQFENVRPEEARSWAYRYGWEKFQHAYKPLIDISMIIIAILGFVLAIIGLLIA